jgi:hypothetical protein
MERKTTWNDPLMRYVASYHELIGERRTRTTFDETIRGMIGAGSLICQQIAVHSAELIQAQEGAQRIIRRFVSAPVEVHRERCAVEGSFKVARARLGREEVEVLGWQAPQTLMSGRNPSLVPSEGAPAFSLGMNARGSTNWRSL